MLLLIIFAFIAGLVTIFSPCILPILPIVLSTSIDGKQSKTRPLGVVFGFVVSFTFFTLFLSTLVRILRISPDVLRLFSVGIVFMFGLTLLIPRLQIYLEQILSGAIHVSPQQNRRVNFWGGFLVGLSLGLLWTPCVGPILASVISLAIVGTVTTNTFIMTLFYSLGTAIPMLAIIYGGREVFAKVPWLTKNTQYIQKAFGLIMLFTSIGILANVDRKFQTYILSKFPGYGVGLTKIEDIKPVQEQLRKLTGSESGTITLGRPSFDLSEKVVAPEIITGGIWLNSSPLTIKQLRGRVILIDFWTYSCINCQRTFPYLRNWWTKYKDKGLTIIGVHSPEFEFEKNENNLKMALNDFHISYPVVQDNNFATWRAYSNNYWPAKYLIDKDGFIRYSHFGEGNYDEVEKVIQTLIEETGVKVDMGPVANPTYQVFAKTPETYLGYLRLSNFASPENIEKDTLKKYTFPQKLYESNVAYDGDWIVSGEYANPQKNAKLRLNFNSKEVFLVMRAKSEMSTVEVYLDGEKKNLGVDATDGLVVVNKDTLYKLIDLPEPGEHILELRFQDSNTEVFAFTFG